MTFKPKSPLSQQFTEALSQSVDQRIQSNTKSTTESTSQSTTQSAAQSSTQSITASTSQSSAQSAGQSSTESCSESTTEPAARTTQSIVFNYDIVSVPDHAAPQQLYSIVLTMTTNFWWRHTQATRTQEFTGFKRMQREL